MNRRLRDSTALEQQDLNNESISGTASSVVNQRVWGGLATTGPHDGSKMVRLDRFRTAGSK